MLSSPHAEKISVALMLRFWKTSVQALMAEISPWILYSVKGELYIDCRVVWTWMEGDCRERRYSRWITRPEIRSTTNNLVRSMIDNNRTISGKRTWTALFEECFIGLDTTPWISIFSRSIASKGEGSAQESRWGGIGKWRWTYQSHILYSRGVWDPVHHQPRHILIIVRNDEVSGCHWGEEQSETAQSQDREHLAVPVLLREVLCFGCLVCLYHE